eukprot:CAMPEP_0196666414 /NCGR_PEP_ID=MMETSP1086-20130531/64499_1 /TAXON_ID=77921 /ORGANISM="Cyanoptyche  gloeocystis , Strain SAG4.97" /LENGTH=63 /DNA_ID=CAMNT_0042003603 /DNA_START=67 /DNA_END=258 /DNA_ORIENTATION=+
MTQQVLAQNRATMQAKREQGAWRWGKRRGSDRKEMMGDEASSVGSTEQQCSGVAEEQSAPTQK